MHVINFKPIWNRLKTRFGYVTFMQCDSRNTLEKLWKWYMICLSIVKQYYLFNECLYLLAVHILQGNISSEISPEQLERMRVRRGNQCWRCMQAAHTIISHHIISLLSYFSFQIWPHSGSLWMVCIRKHTTIQRKHIALLV